MTKKYLIIILVASAILTRLVFLDFRPLHHDEGVNYYFASQILQSGKFLYDPSNYHGPLYFFFLFVSFFILGVSEFTLRLPAAIFGIFLALLPLGFKKFHDTYNKNITSLLLILSPSILYFSRYSIHETALVFFSILAIYLYTRIIQDKTLILLPYLALVLAGLFATKETAILVVFVLFLCSVVNIKTLRGIDWRRDIHHILIAVILFFFLYTAFYSAFFTNMQGVFQSIRGFLPWLERGFSDVGHFKPWYYYLLLILQYELPLALLGIVGLWHARKNIFSKNIAVWFVASTVMYSSIRYKMPWLVINITVPLAILASIGYHHLRFSNTIKKGMLFGTILYLVISTLCTNVLYPWQSINKFAYVHTDNNIIELVEAIQKETPRRSNILIASDTYWPLPFYLREYSVQYFPDAVSINFSDYQNFTIFILSEKIFSQSEIPKNFQTKTFLLRDNVQLYLVFE